MSYTMEEMINLVNQLNYYTERYDAGEPEIPDTEWDKLYFKLIDMEKVLGRLDQSPTQKIHYKIVSSLNKVKHNHEMLSLDKTKDENVVKSFIGNKQVIAMCKMDGLTCSLTYSNRKLVGAETRGDGLVGEDILHNAEVIASIPKYIAWDGEMVIDGEIICIYSDFDEVGQGFKNPRNYAAGSIRLLDSEECSHRKLTFVAWDVVKGMNSEPNLSDKLHALAANNFTVVPYMVLDTHSTEDPYTYIPKIASFLGYPIDGIVFKYDNCEYYKSLGATAHHPRGGLAFKYADDSYESKLISIDWTMGRMGTLTPVAIFDPIDIDGSVVERANLHNLAILQQTLGIPYKDQIVYVAKMNMIIPQIVNAEIKENPDNILYPPNTCPLCGAPTAADGDLLVCTNPDCGGKLINKLDYFCGKKGLEIKGLSKKTLEKLIEWGWVLDTTDLYRLEEHRKEWQEKPGFGPASVNNILAAINKTITDGVELYKFIAAIGIPLIGNNVSKEICKYIDSYEELRQLINENFTFSSWDGFGPEKEDALLNFDYTIADELVKIIKIIPPEEEQMLSNKLQGQNVVITGKLTHYKNRTLLQQDIINNGGSVSNKITRKTTILINNDINSTSAKNIAAKDLGIPIITEADFIATYLT